MLCCHVEPWAVMADITDVQHIVFGNLTDEVCQEDGFKDKRVSLEI